MDMDDYDHTFDDRWLEITWFFQPITHLMPHWGIFPFSVEICRSPLICMIIPNYEIRVRLMIRFHFVLILRWSLSWVISLGSYFLYSCDFWMELSQAHGFPHHHFSGVHVRSFMHPHGVILELSGQIGYIWCHTGAYFPPLAMKAIILSHIYYVFHHSTEIYCICFIGHYSFDFYQEELSVEHDILVLITPLSMILQ